MGIDTKLPQGFVNSVALPTIGDQQAEWQQQNQSWWESHPMRYDWRDRIDAPQFTREYFEEIDRRHFSDAAHYCPPRQRPFDELIPFSELKELDVLEIGVGSGSHAQLIAPHCRSYNGIDLTEFAVESTKRRLELFGIKGTVRQMDAERMDFPDQSFDFIWTWGVIHHSAHTGQILKEMRRVLRPGGKAIVMVYHRSFLYYYIFNGLFRGILSGGFLKTRSLHQLIQQHTDGAIARFYSVDEWSTLVTKQFLLDRVRIKGQKSELFPLPASRFKNLFLGAAPDVVCRFVLARLRQGSFLVSTLTRAADDL